MLRLCQAGDAWRRPRGFYGGECGTIGPLWTIMDHWTFEKCLQMLCVSLWSLKAFGVFTDAPGIASRNDDAQAWVFAAFSALQKRVALVCFKSHWGWWPSPRFQRQVKPLLNAVLMLSSAPWSQTTLILLSHDI